jgi:hypothetical protein
MLRSIRTTGFIAAAICGIAVLGGCTPTDGSVPDPTPSTSASHEPAHSNVDNPDPSEIQDPLKALDDPTSVDYWPDHGKPLLKEQGRGPATFDVTLPDGAKSVTFIVACSPESDFRIEALSNFYAGKCGKRFRDSGEIPSVGDSKDAHVSLSIPEETEFILVAFPNE